MPNFLNFGWWDPIELMYVDVGLNLCLVPRGSMEACNYNSVTDFSLSTFRDAFRALSNIWFILYWSEYASGFPNISTNTLKRKDSY